MRACGGEQEVCGDARDETRFVPRRMGPDVVAARVRKRLRATAASASKPWLLRQLQQRRPVRGVAAFGGEGGVTGLPGVRLLLLVRGRTECDYASAAVAGAGSRSTPRACQQAASRAELYVTQ